MCTYTRKHKPLPATYPVSAEILCCTCEKPLRCYIIQEEPADIHDGSADTLLYVFFANLIKDMLYEQFAHRCYASKSCFEPTSTQFLLSCCVWPNHVWCHTLLLCSLWGGPAAASSNHTRHDWNKILEYDAVLAELLLFRLDQSMWWTNNRK